jgi:hypothetical protein
LDSEEDIFFPFQGRAYALKIYSFQNLAIAIGGGHLWLKKSAGEIKNGKNQYKLESGLFV